MNKNSADGSGIENNYATRIDFDHGQSVLFLDLRDMSILTPRQADIFYDTLETAIGKTGCNWYVVSNYQGCEIGPGAAPQFGFRRNVFNETYSLGSVRFAASAAFDRMLLGNSKDPRYDGNVCVTRDEALARVDELKCG